METDILIWVSIIFGYLLYLIVLLVVTYGWFRLRSVKVSANELFVSVIIAARNEEENIIDCLNSIAQQNYPKPLIEILVADDASEDKTPGLVADFAIRNPELNLKLIRLKEHVGKKNALKTALDLASGDLVITTDSDCISGQNWISAIVSVYIEKDAVFVSGPVDLKFESFAGELLPGLEFMSLIASGAGAIGAGFPIMCNGANMAFSTKHYRQLSGNVFSDEEASGDDIFLMQAFKKQFGNRRITFARNPEAMVFTSPPRTIKHFFSQRLRWTSKSKAYKDIPTILAAISVLLINIMISLLIFAALLKPEFLLPALILTGIKSLTDFPLLFSYASFTGKPWRVAAIVLAEPLVALYTTFTGVAGQFMNVEWKGIKIRKV